MVESPPNGTRPKRTAKQRKCLKCDGEFKPRGKDNHVCDLCTCMNGGIADIEIELPEHLMKKLLYQHYH